MAMKITYEQLNDQTFTAGLRTLGNARGLKVATASVVGKIILRVDAEIAAASALLTKILKDHCELTPTGELKPATRMVPGKEGPQEVPIPGSYKALPEKREALEKATKEFEQLFFEMPFDRIKIAELDKVGFSPLELMALEPLINSLEAVQEK